MKKLLAFLLMLGFAAGNTYAQDDDDEDEYEEEAPKKSAKKSSGSSKKSSEGGASRMGFAVSLAGNQNTIGFVYDMGTGLEVGIGLGLRRYQWTPNEGDAPDPVQTIVLVPNVSYSLGKGLLDYGVGADIGITMEPISPERPDGGTSISATPFFYASGELVKNISLKLSAGVNVDMPAESGVGPAAGKAMTIQLQTAGSLIFYFM